MNATNILLQTSTAKNAALGSLGSHLLASLGIGLLLLLEGLVFVVFEFGSLLLRSLESCC